MTEPLLRAENVSRSFGGVKAVQDVSLSIQPGQRVGFIGPNGAGKSTFVNCLAGDLSPTSGDVLFGGASIRRMPAHARARRGIARTFQHLELFVSMTALENVLVAIDAHSRRSEVFRPGRAREARRRALDALAMLGVQKYADVPTGALPYGIRKLIELSRAFVTEPRLLLLDEPVAGLSDTHEFLEVLDEGLTNLGCAVLLVEHDMPTVQRMCEWVHVLETGRLIASGPYEEVSKNPRVIEAYLGAEHGSDGHGATVGETGFTGSLGSQGVGP